MRRNTLLFRNLVIAVLLGIASCIVAIAVQMPQYILSLSFMWIALVFIVRSPKWRLGVLLAVILGAPPFIDYELAWTAITAFRSTDVGAIRANITQPILCAFDACIAVALLLNVGQRMNRRNGHTTGLPVWYATGLLLLSCLRVLSSVNAMYAYPTHSEIAWAGITSTVRGLAITALTVTGVCNDQNLHNTEFGLSIGVILFVVQSLYVSMVKHGGRLNLGSMQLTGLIPGPGATGAMMVLVVPVLICGALVATNRRHRNILLVSAIAGTSLALLTYSRNVIAGLIVSALVIFIGGKSLRLPTPPRKVVAGLMLSILVTSIMASDWIKAKFRASFAIDLGARINLGARYIYWQVAAGLVEKNWLVGYGTFMWGIVASGFGTNPHNAFIQFAVENGLPAAVIFISLVVIACMVCFHTLRKPRPNGSREFDAFKLGALSGVAGFCTSQLVSSSLGHVRVNLVFWILVTVMLVREYGIGEGGLPEIGGA